MEKGKGKIKIRNKILGNAQGGHLLVAPGVVSRALCSEGDWRLASSTLLVWERRLSSTSLSAAPHVEFEFNCSLTLVQ